MKKVLFATTALIATAGMAAADVRISGYGRFGLDYNSALGTVVSKTNITSRLRIQFDMSTETDGGVVLGARLRMQTDSNNNVVQGGAANGTTTANGARFFVGYGGLSVYVGNVIGALDNTPDIYLPTTSVSIGVDGMGFNQLVITDAYTAGTSTGVGPNGVEALYTAGGFVGHITYSNAGGVDRTGIMGTYSFGDYRISAAYQDSEALYNDIGVITASGDWGRFGAQVAYADNDGSSKWMLAGNFEVGTASNIVAYYADNSNDGFTVGGTGIDGSSYGIEYNLDLGGGATFIAALGSSPQLAALGGGQINRAQAGVHFNF